MELIGRSIDMMYNNYSYIYAYSLSIRLPRLYIYIYIQIIQELCRISVGISS
jgi:hypothetical protein